MIKDVFRVFSTNLIKFFVALIASFLIPALLSVDEYGYYKVFGLYASYIGILHFGYCDGLFLSYGGKNIDEVKKNELANQQFTIVFFEFIISIIPILIGIITKNIIIVLLGLNIVPAIMITFYTFLYQSTGDFKKYAKVYNFQSLATLIINSILVFIIKPNSGIVFACAVVFVYYLTFIIAAFSFNKRYKVGKGKFKLSYFPKYCFSGILLTIGNLSFLLFESIDRWFVKGLLGLTFFAYYSFAGQLLSALNMFANPIGMTLFSYLSKEKNKEFEYTIKTSIIAILFFMLNGVFVLRLIVNTYFSKYEPAKSVIIILFLAQVFLLLNMIVYVNLYKTYMKQKQYFISLIVVIIISIVLNALFYYFIDKSMISISVATLVSMIIWSVINCNNFKDLVLTKENMLFVFLMMIMYLITSFLLNELIGLLVYFVIWLVALVLLMPKVYNFLTQKIHGIFYKCKLLLFKS